MRVRVIGLSTFAVRRRRPLGHERPIEIVPREEAGLGSGVWRRIIRGTWGGGCGAGVKTGKYKLGAAKSRASRRWEIDLAADLKRMTGWQPALRSTQSVAPTPRPSSPAPLESRPGSGFKAKDRAR